MLFWGHSSVRCRRPEHIDQNSSIDSQVVPEVSKILIETVQAKGTASLTELQTALHDAGLGVQEELDAQSALLGVLPRIPALLYMPQLIFMRYVVDLFTYAEPAQSVTEGAVDVASSTNQEDVVPPSGDRDVPADGATPNASNGMLALPANTDIRGGSDIASAAHEVAGGNQGNASFFSFSEFTTPSAKQEHEREADAFLAEMQVAKRPRLDPESEGGRSNVMSMTAASTDAT